MTANLPEVIGLTGPSSGGKAEVAKLLVKRGYKYTSISDRIREEARKRGLPADDTKVLQDLGDEGRRIYDHNVWMLRTLDRDYKRGQKLVIDSIRHPAEIDALRLSAQEVFIIGIDADREKRLERALKRARGGLKSEEEFIKLDEREFSGKEGSHEIQLDKCLELADHLIVNNGSKKELEAELERTLVNRRVEGAILGPERR